MIGFVSSPHQTNEAHDNAEIARFKAAAAAKTPK
jgi:hypothetical protein